ncbi:hypothetical protein QWY85_08865 [Neolewinella lacunae]|uniref:Uncharacterized protein n=1 Tax=Neolewinella lacunae TaxID=1517758 RepID=A0A923PM24_9BACT|nr:hypothetical protein [Neolewinella lacunae]MBC6996668.1 hypothetical protein [Neolewinella lacunae]MDN3634767.1 hypothetical protein [Neolewinella lacunae]
MTCRQSIRFLPLLLLLACFSACSARLAKRAQEAAGPIHLALRPATGGPEYYLPGAEVPLLLEATNTSAAPSDSLRLRIQLPAGLRLADPAWHGAGTMAQRTLPPLGAGNKVQWPLTTRLATDATGPLAVVTAGLDPGQKALARLSIPVGRVLENTLDTCRVLHDTLGNRVNTYLTTRRLLRTVLPGPLALGPLGPVRVSPRNCAAFALNAPVKKHRAKDRCSCLHFSFASGQPTYPTRFQAGEKPLQTCATTTSAGAKGDTLRIAVRTLDGQPLRRMLLTDGSGKVLQAAYAAAALDFCTVLDADTATWRLYLQADRRFYLLPRKQYVLVDVTRHPAAVEILQDAGPAPAPEGSTTLLASTPPDTVGGRRSWWETSALRTAEQTIFLRVRAQQSLAAGAQVLRDTLGRDSCAGQFAVRQLGSARAVQTWIATDTLLFQATQAEAEVVGLRNLSGLRSGSVEVNIPLRLDLSDPPARDSLVAIAYWIGSGEVALGAYAALLESVPPAWSQPGVSAPLAAYGGGYPVVLPGLTPGEAEYQRSYVQYDFTTSAGRQNLVAGRSYPRLIRRNPDRPNYGVVTGTALQQLAGTVVFDPALGKRVLRFHFAFANRHPVNTYRLQLKIVAWYQVRTPATVWQPITP